MVASKDLLARKSIYHWASQELRLIANWLKQFFGLLRFLLDFPADKAGKYNIHIAIAMLSVRHY